MSEAGAASQKPRRVTSDWRFWSFIVLMAGLTVLFAMLGNWQLDRLAQKDALIAAVVDRAGAPPRDLPPLAEWVGFDAAIFDFRPVTVSGTYVPASTVLVFTSLSEPRGQHGGAGYWVMTPLRLEGGGTVFVNRGFVPERLGASFKQGGPLQPGPTSITGMARAAEAASSFTPGPNAEEGIDFIRNPSRLAGLSDANLSPVAPIYIDLPAGEPGALPQGGEAVMSFPNNHLGYAYTWFGFALLTPVLLAAWIWRQLQPPRRDPLVPDLPKAAP